MRQYIRQLELDAMPLEPRARFVAIYELANDRFDEEVASIDGREDWHQIERARVRFASTMIGFAKSLGISEVIQVDFPAISRNDGTAFDAFELSLGHFVAQFMSDNSLRANLDSIELRGAARERLQTLAATMRAQVEELDLTPERRAALRRHIEAFERELQGARLQLLALAKLAIGVALAVGGMAEGTVAFFELHDRVVRTVAEEKDVQDHERSAMLIASSEERRATPLLQIEAKVPVAGEDLTAELDDEIPF